MPGMMGGMTGGMSKGKGRGPPKPPSPPHAVPNGTSVVIRGLTKSQEYNGKTGRINGWDAAKGRYEVEIDDGDTTLSLRPASLTQPSSVTVVGIESQPDLNGRPGEILNFDEGQGRYMVKLKSKMQNGRDVCGLQPGNVVLPQGVRVVTQGLSNGSFNGKMAQITAVDTDASRYTVSLEDGKTIKIKFENVIC